MAEPATNVNLRSPALTWEYSLLGCLPMNRAWISGIVLGLLALLLEAQAQLTRAPGTALAMPAAPPTFGFTFTNAFPTITFTNPTTILSPPGETNRLFIVEKRGRIVVITNLAAPTRTIFMDISSRVITGADTSVGSEEGLLGMAFHPGYSTNRYFYVFYTGNATTAVSGGTNSRHDILARYEISTTNQNRGNTNTQQILFAQKDDAGNHNGGDTHFGADGYLYVALGDEGGADDQYANSQKIDRDFFSAFVRLDVDKRATNLPPNFHASLAGQTNYFVPRDNPWVGATNFNGSTVNSNNVRTEFWAVGMRNPWRWSFDSVSGLLYLGHVGQGAHEWINIVTKGGNAGWNYWEGIAQRVNPTPAGFTRTILPLVDYTHTGGRVCVIGGVVYHGDRLPQLTGAYLYADYGSSEIWMLRHTGTNVTQNSVMFQDSGAAITGFGVDPSNGDALYIAVRSGVNSQIRRIIYNTTTNGAPVPPTLAATGAFTNLTSLDNAQSPLNPTASIVPYDLNVPFWSDNAIKTRWFSVPNTNLDITFNSNANWSFPTGTVWIKHFNLELTNGVPASQVRLETRFLVKNSNGVYGVTYRWGGSRTNAALVPPEGMDESFVVNNGGTLRTQVWHYPSWNECAACHTAAGGFGLGFRTEQLNRDFTHGSLTTNQITALNAAGYFSTPVTNSPGTLLVLAHATNDTFSLEYRARSFLAANCSQCHQPGGTAQQASWDARITTPTSLANLVNITPVNNLGGTNNFLIAPQSPTHSALLTRISTRDLGSLPSVQMPPLDSTLVDTQAVQLVTDWINSLSADGRFITPAFNLPAQSSSTNFVLRGANGWPGQTYYIVTSTNLALPLNQWAPVFTNVFNPTGDFIFNHPINPASPGLFYRLRLP